MTKATYLEIYLSTVFGTLNNNDFVKNVTVRSAKIVVAERIWDNFVKYRLEIIELFCDEKNKSYDLIGSV